MTPEPIIICPSCKTEIKLTESLAAPLLEATKRDYEAKLAAKDADFAEKRQALRDQQAALDAAKAAIDDTVAEKLKVERAKIAAEETKRAKLALTTELDDKSRAIDDLKAIVEAQNTKLTEAQQAQADLLRKQRELDDAKREFDLNLEKGIQAGLAAARDKAKNDAAEEQKLMLAEKDKTIESMKTQIDVLKRKADQGSQQLQGEVLELELEAILKAKFPIDTFEPVPKGEHGGDLLHRVNGPLGQICGTILWESKRTKNWNDGWLSKLRDDQRAAKAEIAVIVSQALPKECDTFALIDGVWVAHPRCAFPVAVSLRQTLIEAATARQAGEGQQTKMELVYQYLTGPRFRQRVQAMVEVFATMNEDLDKERKAILKQWDKRRMQIDRVVQATVGMYGDLQGIAGKSLQEIEGVDLRALEASQ